MKTPLLDNIFSDDLYFKDDLKRTSCMTRALIDARIISGRNPTTGEISYPFAAPLTPDSWGSALLYLILLEQIGACFKTKNDSFKGNPIYKALKYFANIPDKECSAIEALRHSFAHSYSLCNVKYDNNNKLDQNRTHLYTIMADEVTPVVTLPEVPWLGTFSSKSEDKQRTTINIQRLGDLVEEILKRVKKEYFNDNIEIILKGKEAALLKKYTTLNG